MQHELVRSNLGFVAWIARDYRDRGVPQEDLVAEGNLGLLEAARRFDAARGTKFTTYAAWWIRKFMRTAIEGAPVVRRTGRAIGLDDPPRHDAGEPLAARLVDRTSPDPATSLLEGESSRLVREAVVALPPLEREVLAHRFGLEDRPLLSLRETGLALGMCGERVRQIERRSLDRVRRTLLRADHHLSPTERPIKSGVSRSNFTTSSPCGLR